MKFYHGTTKEKWKLIQAEGVLWGVRKGIPNCRPPDRATWLAVEREDAERFGGPVILEVEYEPDNNRTDEKGPLHNHWEEGCWQLHTYEPIPIENVRVCAFG